MLATRARSPYWHPVLAAGTSCLPASIHRRREMLQLNLFRLPNIPKQRPDYSTMIREDFEVHSTFEWLISGEIILISNLIISEFAQAEHLIIARRILKPTGAGFRRLTAGIGRIGPSSRVLPVVAWRLPGGCD